MKQNRFFVSLFITLISTLFFAQSVFAAKYTYNISWSVDYSGPYAVLMPVLQPTSKALFAWWNETKGKELGIELVTKQLDTRYDPSVVASSWPGVLSSVKPIAHLGLGGPDVAALMKRLPNDKVPMFMSTATYGFIWLPNMWVFQPRPTYSHEAIGFLKWFHDKNINGRKLRLGILSSKVSPAYVDIVNGFRNFEKGADWLKVVGVEWVQMKPVSLVSEIRRLSREKPDFIYIGTNTSHVIAVTKAKKELGLKIPILSASHNSIQMSAYAARDMSLMEGNYDSYAVDPGINLNNAGAKTALNYCKKMELKCTWGIISVQFSVQQLLVMRAVERAAAKVGSENITGEAVYNAMYYSPFTEEDLLELAPTMTFTKDGPFSTLNLKVKATTVENGKQIMVTKDWIPIPNVPKWVK